MGTRWNKIKASLAHAFAYDDGREQVSPEDIALLDKVAEWVVRRRLVAPAVLLLESTAPLNFVGSSLMTFFRPIVGVVFNTTQYERFEALLERRCALRLMVERIELKEREADAARAEAKKARDTQAPPPSDAP